MSPRLRRALVSGALLSAFLLAGCGDGEGADVSCTLQSCTVTFQRGVEASASIFGVEAQLVEVKSGWVTIDIDGNRISVPVGSDAGGITVREVTDEHVVLVIPHGAIG